MLRVGDVFPDMTLECCTGDNKLDTYNTSINDGKWHVFYFYPKDFTFICPTEIRDFDKLLDHDCHVAGFSGDNEFCKLNWKKNDELIKDVKHPLVADTGLRLSSELDIVDEENGVCFRATFICDPDNVIQHASINALDTGRNVDEVIRTLHALKSGGLTACSWNIGDEFVG